MSKIDQAIRKHLDRFLNSLIDQEKAKVIVAPYQSEPGFWFGGGSLVQDKEGVIWLSGRYRNVGDSRTGLEQGQRGLECAIFRSDDDGKSFHKVRHWNKEALSYDHRVVSYEGTALNRQADGTWELFISSEKDISYPDPLHPYQKPGTGVWTIDRMTGPSPDDLDPSTLAPVLSALDHPEYLHVKDPVVFDTPDGQTALAFCSHPFSWSAGNTGLALRPATQKSFQVHSWEVVTRGACWDVAATRITDRLQIPRVGIFADLPPCSVYFYDGAECLRDHEENVKAYPRPRGFSCEEIGGAFFGWDDAFPTLQRLSVTTPMFISPHGTGCSRYTATLTTDTGILAMWQQAQPDGSQPLVGHLTKIGESV